MGEPGTQFEIEIVFAFFWFMILSWSNTKSIYSFARKGVKKQNSRKPTLHSTWSWVFCFIYFGSWFYRDQMQSQSLILREKVSKNRIPGSPWAICRIEEAANQQFVVLKNNLFRHCRIEEQSISACLLLKNAMYSTRSMLDKFYPTHLQWSQGISKSLTTAAHILTTAAKTKIARICVV